MRTRSTGAAPRALLALLLPLLLPALAFVLGRPRPLPRADFAFVLPKENATLDPALATTVSDGWLVAAIFEGLVRFDPETLAIAPASARSWSVSDDGLEFRFELDPAARWSDGKPVTAADFEYSWKRLLDPEVASPNGAFLAVVAGAREAIAGRALPDGRDSLGGVGIAAEDDGRTLHVTLRERCPYFLQLAAHFALAPVRRDCVERFGEAFTAPENLICNGPYRAVLRRVRDRVRLERNEAHPRSGSIDLRVVDALAIDSKATALNLFLSGDVDWVNALPALSVPRLEGRPELRLAVNLGTIFLRMNVQDERLKDVRVRRAIDAAIDRDALCRYVWRTGESPATSLVPPRLPHYVGPAPKAPARIGGGELAQARALLASAGFPGGAGFPEIELLHASDETARAAAEAIADQLSLALSIRVRPSPQEFKVFIDSMRGLRYQIALGNWIGDYPDPTTFLDVFRADSPNNRTGWKDAAYDAALDAAALEVDPAARAEKLAAAERLLLETGPIAPLAWRGQANLVSDSIEGFADNLLDLHPLDRLRRRR